MGHQTRLSKSRFLSGSQCHLRLWNDFHASSLAAEPSDTQYSIFDTGHEVGELACERYPDGRLIAQDHLHFDEALEETAAVLKDGSVPAIFEPAFEYEGLIARVDILERLPTGGWRMIEVKSTTQVKPIHELDLAFQVYLSRGAGLDVREAGVLTLNRDYVYDGKSLDLDELFKFHPIEGIDQQIASIQEHASEMQELVTQEQPPDIEPGDHCFSPYKCLYHAHCTRELEVPDRGIDEIPRLSTKRKAELRSKNIVEIRKIPLNFPLNKLQRIARRAVIDDRELVHRKNLATITELETPIRHLDFETFPTPIPRFANTSPYNSIPFLFSVHTECEDSDPIHTDYLHVGNDDPRNQLVEELISSLGESGAICTYSTYEHTVINALIRWIPSRTEELESIKDRFFDLCSLIKKSFYHPDFRGSFSLKAVFPVLCPDSGYDDLDIADGQLAAVEYLNALKTEELDHRTKVFRNLRDYCERDTLAMVKVRQALLTRL